METDQPTSRLDLLTLAVLPLLLALGSSPALAQTRGPDDERPSRNGKAEGTVGETVVTIHYGRPKAKGREIWGLLVPYGDVWRAGANEATTITLSREALLEGHPVPAGTYSMFLIPNQSTWTFVINKVADQWGAYRYDAAQDLVRFDVVPQPCERVEEMTIRLEGERVVLAWGSQEGGFRVAG